MKTSLISKRPARDLSILLSPVDLISKMELQVRAREQESSFMDITETKKLSEKDSGTCG